MAYNFTYEFNDFADNSTIVYHMLGRNPEIEPTSTPYDSMADKLLSLLPKDYHMLFNAMLWMTLIFTVIMLFEFALVIKEKLKIQNELFVYSIPLMITLISPEILYLSITFKSSIIGFAFALCGQLILLKGKKSNFNLIISSAMFAFGVSMRWDILIYVTVMIYEIIRIYFAESWKQIIYKLLVWGISSLVFITLFMYLSGYSMKDVVETALWGQSYIKKNTGTTFQLVSLVLEPSAFFTPAFLLLFLTGFFLMIKNKKYDMMIYLGVSFIPFIFLGILPFPKYIMVMFPALFTIVFYPFIEIKNETRKKVLIGVASLLVFFNWFIGIRVNADNTVFGPGFSYKSDPMNFQDNELAADKRIKVKDVSLGFWDGFIFPTREGARPLFGHFHVLFGGKYRDYLSNVNSEYVKIINKAKTGIPILTDRRNATLEDNLVSDNYLTSDPYNKATENIKIPTDRRFYKKDSPGDTINVYRFLKYNELFNKNDFREFFKGKEIILAFTYSSLLINYLETNKEFMHVIDVFGPYSCLVKID